MEFEFIFLIWYFCPLSRWSQTNVQMPKKLKDMIFFKHANSKYESSITNATSFSFILYFMFA